jgi:NUMOD4 motif/HNH endonuclease/AP2 domain
MTRLRPLIGGVFYFMKTQEEIWKDIPNYEGLYQVSNLGNVKSLPKEWFSGNNTIRKHEGKFLKFKSYNGNYCKVTLHKNAKRKIYKVHQLVAMAFLGHKPCGLKLVVDHINDIKTDNRLENLQIVTNRYNAYKTQGKHTSKYKGVSWNKVNKKWHSQISINNIKIHLGYFDCEFKAHLAYQNKLKELL